MAAQPEYNGRLTLFTAAPRMLLRAWVALCFAVAVVLLPGAAGAQQIAKVEPIQGEGFGRLIFTFPKPMKIKLRATPGVVVVSFPEPVKLDVGKVSTELPSYIGAARTDPDGGGARFALAAAYNVNMMEAAEKVVIDLLPSNWKGLPPPLPREIIDELAERARNTEKRRAEQDRAARVASAKPIDVSFGLLPTFTRMVFEWGQPTNARIERDGEAVTVDFEHPGKVNVGGIKAQLPEWVGAIDSGFSDDGGLRVTMTVDPSANVRGFPEGDTYVVDVTNPDWAGERNPLETVPAAADEKGGLRVAGQTSDAVSEPAKAPETNGVSTTSRSFNPGQFTEVKQRDGDNAEAGHVHKQPLTDQERAAHQAVADIARQETSKPAAPAAPAAEPKSSVVEDAAPNNPSKTASAFDAAARVTPAVHLSGSLVNVSFPFSKPTASAVFIRDRFVWMIFDTPIPIDVRVLRNDLQDLISDLDYSRSGSEQVLRMTLREPQLVSSSLNENSWVVTLGDLVLTPPKPLAVERRANDEHEGLVDIALPTANTVHEIEDPDRETKVKVVSAFGPARAIFKPQDFVEFQIEPSIHGVVVHPLADDIAVNIADGHIEIGRPRGLVLSGEGAKIFEASNHSMGEYQRPGYVSIENETLIGDGSVGALIARTHQAVAELPEEERTAGRLRLARLYLATDLAAEGLGMLRYARSEDPGVERDPSFRALFGVGKVLMGRNREALKEFDTFRLGDSKDISLWRGLAYIGLGDWPLAEHEFLQGEPAIGGYTVRRQLQFRLAAARAALEVGDMEMASRQIGAAEALLGNVEADDELLLLWGWLNERSGRDEQALAAYTRVAKSRDRKLEAEATLHLVSLQNKTGTIKPEEAIEKLETLAIVWRGDTIELNTLAELAKLHVKKKNYRRAFELMKAAAISDADSPITRALENELDDVFADLFIAGNSNDMPPVDALALYYDFREMTPVDRRGDEMIRALADRLIEVDLLDQAAQLLEHQVDNRLHGAGRAQVAAKLALVHLMNRKPEKALEVIARTRQAVLPHDVQMQRTVLEARALSETGRADLAVELLSTMDGPDIARLKADALWRAEDWQEAGDELERLLGKVWSNDKPLSEPARYDVMRAAIAFSLAGDNLGLGRIRSKFAAMMSGTPDGTAFDVVTGGLPEAAGNIHDVIAKIAGTDTLDAFLSDYKERFEVQAAPSS
ncbi:MAG: hypothetical protein KDJ55_04415 [Rhodobiaceae bacterium]|nr:hypothetical protein [Rhodobiaceae bacterium]MCC0012201.1 hypothetical protein [Rhodobiaceae bacterium]MCC0050943.1 hypothetical protein [Rhodobiaceae bacterium]MCC0060884.1 hypothetical protein [Rhodobiaceae bacterium]